MHRYTTAVITGAMGGLGSGVVGEVAAASIAQDIVAIVRRKSPNAHSPASVTEVLECDLRVPAEVSTCGQRLIDRASEGRWLWILAAGIYDDDAPLDALTPDSLGSIIYVNAVSQLQLVANAARYSLGPHDVIAVSSGMGSVEASLAGDHLAYGASKAVLNFMTRQLSHNLENVRAIVVNPGWMRTRLGGPEAPYSAETSAQRLMELLLSSQIWRDPGGLRDIHDGPTIPW